MSDKFQDVCATINRIIGEYEKVLFAFDHIYDTSGVNVADTRTPYVHLADAAFCVNAATNHYTHARNVARVHNDQRLPTSNDDNMQNTQQFRTHNVMDPRERQGQSFGRNLNSAYTQPAHVCDVRARFPPNPILPGVPGSNLFTPQQLPNHLQVLHGARHMLENPRGMHTPPAALPTANVKRAGRIRVRSGTSNGFETVVRLAEEEQERERLARIHITPCNATTTNAQPKQTLRVSTMQLTTQHWRHMHHSRLHEHL